jgi:hypothetical protein
MNTNTWRKSSRSEAQNACVELVVGIAATDIRDSKNHAAQLAFAVERYRAFLTAVKRGTLSA